jgi:hypothetical protein
VTGLKLRDDAYYVATSDGVYILTPQGEVVMTGRSIYGWVDQLAPYLDGRHTLAELTAALPTGRKQMTERVISALRDRGVVVETREDADQVYSLTSDERRLYSREIAFLGYSGSSGERSFQAYRDNVIALAGAGQLLTETVWAALNSGSRTLRVALTGADPAGLIVLADCERRAWQRDPRQRIICSVADPADEDRLSDLVTGAGIAVYASDLGDFDQVRALDRLCSRASVPFVAAILAGDHAWLGPFGTAIGGRPSWMSAWRRLLALEGGEAGRVRPEGACRPGPGFAGDGPAEDDPAGNSLAGNGLAGDGGAGNGRAGNSGTSDGRAAALGDPRAGATLAVVANQLAREAMRQLSGTATSAEPARVVRVVRVDLRSLRTESHSFLPHSFSLTATHQDRAGLAAAVDRLREGERLDPEEFSGRMASCLDPRLGVLSEVTEQDFAQVPLAVAQVRVSDPVRLLDPGGPLPVVTGAGLSLAEARRAAVLRGLAVYGSLMVDPRRLHVRGDAPGLTGDPAEDLAALRAGQWSGFVWGHGLADERPNVLAAEAVFPALRGAARGNAPPPGVAAGHDWVEAVGSGLVGQCRRLTLNELDAGQRQFTLIEWTEVALDAAGRRYRSMAAVLGDRLGVYDVTGSLRVPTLAFRLDGVTVAYASGFSFGDALRNGLAEVLLFHQAQADGEAPYAPSRVPPLPEHGCLPGIAACPAWSIDAAGAVAQLAHLGWSAVAVPLDHDPSVTGSILPYLVNVVVARG